MRYGLTESNTDDRGDRMRFPAQSSVLDEEALFHRVVNEYRLERAESCRFFCRGDSDVYAVLAQGETFYLKIYRPPHSLARAEAEAVFVNDLQGGGAPVVSTVARKDGRYATRIEASEGLRPALLFESAPADRFDFGDIAACRKLGRAVARLHDTTDRLDSKCDLEVFDVSTVTRDRLPFARVHLRPSEFSFLQDTAGRVASVLDDLPRSLPHFGLCHADLALSNIRRRGDDSVVFFDFGDASITWRAYDLMTARAALPGKGSALENSPHRDALLDGYASIRELPAGIPGYATALVLCRRLLWFCSAFAACPLRMGTEGFSRNFIENHLPGLREMAGDLA